MYCCNCAITDCNLLASWSQDPGSSAVGGRVGMEGAQTKRFAPVAEALQPGVTLKWTKAAGGGRLSRL